MKKYNPILIFLFCGILFFASFICGYKMMSKTNRELVLEDDDSYKKQKELEILGEEERISPNTFIEKKVYYKQCEHSITKLDNVSEEIVNLTETQFREYIKENYPNIKILSFSPKKIVLKEERNHLCPNHYIIGESDGKIAIYRINEEGSKYLDRVFKDYPISLLKEIDQEKLKNGIIVDSEEELSDVLENFIS
ncbi:BofC-like protein [Keratinibaculum paraultunense]|uniref:BofC-like protein n=1 Tax=Keratinibaculum paraultunense TaxID=1278232 RepID=A0A4R3KXB0_9FIRM|nr:BofC C-terminal domain-containing protein [Keratinibaculum paraultunense]QQY78767.1 BofC C-terminal domain-containing protein [Keratinibaculum paraultunense]TCS89548.1 BofC-like protein [Keratinibaculum paraultunense]